MTEGEFKKRMHAQRFAGITSPQQIWLSEADKILDEARAEIMAHFTCLPELQQIVLKWIGESKKNES